MGDDVTQPAATAPVANGNGKRKVIEQAIWLLSALLASCITASVMLAYLSVYHPPAQWDFVNKVIDNIDKMGVLLAGGLLALLRTNNPS